MYNSKFGCDSWADKSFLTMSRTGMDKTDGSVGAAEDKCKRAASNDNSILLAEYILKYFKVFV